MKHEGRSFVLSEVRRYSWLIQANGELKPCVCDARTNQKTAY